MRVVKHIGARSIIEDDAKVLMAIPTGPGEKIMGGRISAYFASGDDSAIDQPGECNWYGIMVPWSLVFATSLLDGGQAPSILDTVAKIDTLYEQWLASVNESGTEMYGGDVDADPETKSGEEGHVSDELLDSGPIGVAKWYSRETLMLPLAAEGNTVIRFGDFFQGRIPSIPAPKMGGLALFGMVRFAAAAETNFNIELDDVTSKEAMGYLISGDYTTINARVEGDTGAIGDYLRTVLYGGDNYVEADTLKGPAGKAVVKANFFIKSALSRHQR